MVLETSFTAEMKVETKYETRSFNVVLLIADIFVYAVSYLPDRYFKKRLLRYPPFCRYIW